MNPGSRRRAAAILVLAAALLLASCSGPVAGTANIGTTVPAVAKPGSTSPSGPVDVGAAPAGLAEYYEQEMDWGSCAELATSEETKFFRAPSLQCADLTVPLSYDDPTGPTMTLKVLRKPATDPADRIGSVVVNPGGPGASGVEVAGTYAAFGLARAVNERFDFVGFDPRGVGSSWPPIQCQTDEERDAGRATTTRTRTPQEIDAANALAQRLAQGCAQLSGGDPTAAGSNGQTLDGATVLGNVGTRNVARDMDILRAALGDRQLTYIGWSYGTSIGTEYARQFPDNVRAMILDGAVDPNEDPAESNLGQAEGFQQTFDDFSAWCAEQSQCPLGTDPAAATANYQTLVRPLLDEPLALADGRVITFNDATTGTFSALYSESLWSTLSSALTALGAGDGTELMGLADSYLGRNAQGHYSNLQDAFLAIGCSDGSRTVDPAAAQQLAEKAAAAAPFLASGDPPAAIKDPCDFWPVTPTPLEPVESAPPGLPEVLVISTTHDPATPYEAGVNLATTLGARLLTVDGSSHTAYLGTGNACADRIGNDYLINLTLPDEGTTC